MKAFAFVLLCALAAVQGRNTGLQSTRSAAALGENPWLVHLRIAVSSSGLLNTGAGTFIGNSNGNIWVLTAASAVDSTTFVWTRYGVVNVVNPSLVLENGNAAVHFHPNYNATTGENNIALIGVVGRSLDTTENIAPISLGSEVADAARFCNWGGDETPGEILNCYDVAVAQEADGSLSVSSEDVRASAKFDIGAPLVSNGALVGFLTAGSATEGRVGDFLAVADYLEWIEQVTGLVLNPEVVPDVAPEAVRFVQ